ncbi:MAG TPA: LysR family transcriptional regulator [Variovorax sp.]|nr:LysR family transcriptional regulator [Variovorax sp.]
MASAQTHLLARLRFRHLQLIDEVDRTGSLSRAAEVLNLTQPALSKALKEIEDMLGFEVFHRGARGLQKTPQGAVVIHGAALLLRELLHVQAEAEAAGVDGNVSAVLRLGTSAFLAVGLLPPVIARLTAQVPPMAVRLREDNVPRLFESLLTGELDALVTLYNSDVMAATAGREVQFERISEERYVVIAPASHRLSRSRSVTWQALAREPWVLTLKPSLARVFVEDIFRRHGMAPPAPLCETVGPLTAACMVAAGVGLSSVPESTAQDALRNQSISLVKVGTPLPSATLGLVYRTAAAGHPRIMSLRNALELCN